MKHLKIFLFLILCFLSLALLCSCDKCLHLNMLETEIAATCTSAGKTVYSCKDCGYAYDDRIVEPKGHIYDKTVTDPTCETGGYTTYLCSCGHSYVSDHTSAQGHNFTTNTKISPTCTAQGYTYHKCDKCEYSYIDEVVKPVGHNFANDTVVTQPTCTSQGYTTYNCSDCDYCYVSDYKAVTEHQLSQSITAPTCTERGYTTYSCKTCDYKYVSDYTDPCDHTYISSILSSVTCTTEGITQYECACGDKYTITVGANGHDFDRTVTMPTLSDMGYTDFSCKNCEYTYVGDFRFYKDILPNGAYAENTEVLAHGIDISEYNYGESGSIDFAALKAAGVDYVIIKAGSSYRNGFSLGGIDPKFEQSYADAKAAGLDVGIYFYTYARSVDDIIYDAELLLTILSGKQFEYPIYLDLEDDSLGDISAATLTEMCVGFFSVLQRAGYYTGLYVNNEWLSQKLQSAEALSKFEIWYARYPESATDLPTWNEIEYGAHLGMWQYSDEGAFEAVPNVPFDLNFAYKDYPTIIKSGGFNGYDSDVRFIDDGKQFVYVISNAINIRSTPDFDSTVNIIGTAIKGARFEVIEKSTEYTKIRFNGQTAYITANTDYITFEMPKP